MISESQRKEPGIKLQTDHLVTNRFRRHWCRMLRYVYLYTRTPTASIKQLRFGSLISTFNFSAYFQYVWDSHGRAGNELLRCRATTLVIFKLFKMAQDNRIPAVLDSGYVYRCKISNRKTA